MIGNSQYSVNVSELSHGIYDVKVNGETFNISIGDILASTKIPVKTLSVEMPAEKSADASGNVIKSAMPGTVMAIKVKVGDTVKNGDILLTLETMKMENPIRSTKDGKVKQIVVQPGKFVNVGDRLIVID
jgi:biotin carboxyl carrier protein